jgi:hypothetical protein
MASDFLDDSLGGLLSSGKEGGDFDSGESIPKCLDRGSRDLLALGVALDSHNSERPPVPHYGQNGPRAALGRSWQADVGEAGDECAFRGDILQLDHVLRKKD